MQVPEHRRTVAKKRNGTVHTFRQKNISPAGEPTVRPHAAKPDARRKAGRTPQSRTPTVKRKQSALTDALLIFRLRKPLFNLDLARGGGSLLDLLLGNVDGHHTVFDLGRNILALDIVGQQQALLELRVGEFAAQVGAFALGVLLLVLGLLLQRDHQLVVFVDVDLEVLLGHTRSGDLDLVFVFTVDDVDGGSRGAAALGQPVVAQNLVENSRQPVLIRSCRCHNFVLLGFIRFNCFPFYRPLSERFHP